jgi:6-phosphogluconolactonase
LKIKSFRGGQVSDLASIAPGAGYSFGPRHIDFHPTKPWLYASIERQNQSQMYRFRGDGLEPAPAFVLTTLAEPGNLRPEQMVGPIHVHPNGRSRGTVSDPRPAVPAHCASAFFSTEED